MRIFLVLGLVSLLVACGDSPQPESSQPESVPDAALESLDQQQSDVEVSGEPVELVESVISDTPSPATLTKMPMVDKTDPGWKSKVTAPEMMSFEEGKTYLWELETNQGTMTFRLFHNESPKHANSTIYLTELGFYDDVLCHRVIPGFMAQGGDPTGTGRGGPAYKYDGEFAAGLSHTKPGLLSMANAGPGTDGSQFFITFVATPFLDGKHTIFGEMTEGTEVLQALEARGSRSGATSEELKIVAAKVLVQ
jgi:peptidyl-prolyl cis-trans isomerase B (cyclophilin B)